MSKAIPFESLVVGQELGPFEYDVDEQTVAKYCADWQDPNPMYLERSSAGLPVAPPSIMAGLACFALLRTGGHDTTSTLGAKTENRNLRPLLVGQKVTVKGHIADKYIKRGLEYVVVASTSFDAAGHPFRESVDHVLLGVGRVDGQGG